MTYSLLDLQQKPLKFEFTHETEPGQEASFVPLSQNQYDPSNVGARNLLHVDGTSINVQEERYYHYCASIMREV